MDNIKYLGVTITNDLKWNTHISNICTKANRTLGFLRQTLFSCPQNVKEAAYKGWCVQSWSMEARSGTPILISFKKNWKRFKIVRQGLWPEIMFMKLGVWLAFLDKAIHKKLFVCCHSTYQPFYPPTQKILLKFLAWFFFFFWYFNSVKNKISFIQI